MASAMAFQFFFSLFPTLLVAVMVLRQLPFEGLQEAVLKFIVQFFPEGGLGSAELEEAAKSLFSSYFPDTPNPLVVAFLVLLALWGALRGIVAMMKAFSKQNKKLFKRRKVWELYGMALVIFMVLGSIIIVGVALRLGVAYLMFYLSGDLEVISVGTAQFISGGFELLITVVMLFCCISVLFFLAPATEQRWKFISPGAILVVILMLAALVGLRSFFVNFTNYDQLYGSLTAIIVIMVWFYYLSIVMLIGFELNSAIDIASEEKRRLKEREEEIEEEMDIPLEIFEE
ncbi:MAG: YihY/virulence factor BrkB family protein [Bacteroidota bacterium]